MSTTRPINPFQTRMEGQAPPNVLQAADVAFDIFLETRRAMTLHAPMNSLHEGKAVIEEEFDEFWEQVKINPKKLTGTEQERRRERLKSELIQTAAMCVRTIVDLGL